MSKVAEQEEIPIDREQTDLFFKSWKATALRLFLAIYEQLTPEERAQMKAVMQEEVKSIREALLKTKSIVKEQTNYEEVKDDPRVKIVRTMAVAELVEEILSTYF